MGDGAHWIWNIADLHFPGATQILDWYHASEYVWAAARAIWGEGHPQCEVWAHRQLDALWEGQVHEVLAALEQQRDAGDEVTAALSYDTTHRRRMDYAAYRARGLHIGSGSVESGCKQLVSARLKQAGMMWDAAGAEAVAGVRAWLKRGRWAEAVALRPARGRSYQRQPPVAVPEVVDGPVRAGAPVVSPAMDAPLARGLSPEVLATIRTEQARDKEQHPWRKAWSVKRQREQPEAPLPEARRAIAA